MTPDSRWQRIRNRLIRVKRTWLPRLAYSQEGEDLLLLRLFGQRPVGYYVDIGAFHPRAYSNTCLLFRRGWRGINIDPSPGVAEAFARARPHDINLALAIGLQAGQATLNRFEWGELNTLSHAQVDLVDAFATPVGTVTVPVKPLTDVLDQHLPRGQRIDLMNVDVEGFDLEVLQSNDWTRYRPSVLCIECLFLTAEEVLGTELHRFLAERDYVLYAKTANTCVYIDRDQLDALLPMRKASGSSDSAR